MKNNTRKLLVGNLAKSGVTQSRTNPATATGPRGRGRGKDDRSETDDASINNGYCGPGDEKGAHRVASAVPPNAARVITQRSEAKLGRLRLGVMIDLFDTCSLRSCSQASTQLARETSKSGLFSRSGPSSSKCISSFGAVITSGRPILFQTREPTYFAARGPEVQFRTRRSPNGYVRAK